MIGKLITFASLALSYAAGKGHAAADAANHWAVIVAGSKGYSNYRHQADACHAYQIAKKNGIPEEQIIMLAYDDVAHSFWNVWHGKLFNKPTARGTPGVDVYAGCNINYKGDKATAANVLAVLKGDAATAGGPVLKSDENSKVFFFFADHGAPGLVAMPTGGYLYADKFHEAIKFMHTNKMYKEMVVYIEACESGSMFENLLEDNLNVYAVSAANSTESSWATYCGPDDKVDGWSLDTCLGDLFSVNWMENTEGADISKESLQDQYGAVQKQTTRSMVLQWGQKTFTSEPIGDFEGTLAPAKSKGDFWGDLKQLGKRAIKDYVKWDQAQATSKNLYAVDSRDAKLSTLYARVMANASEENHRSLQNEIQNRMKIDKIFNTAFPERLEAIKKGAHHLPTDFGCYRSFIQHFEEKCGAIDEYALKYFKVFVGECESLGAYPELLTMQKAKLEKACTNA